MDVGKPDTDGELQTPCASGLFQPLLLGFTRVHSCEREIVVFRSQAPALGLLLGDKVGSGKVRPHPLLDVVALGDIVASAQYLDVRRVF